MGRNGGLPLETLQYVVGVGQFRTLLRMHDAALRRHAATIRLDRVRPGDDWPVVSARLGIPEWELRLHNPFLAGRTLRLGQLVAYPGESRPQLLRPTEGGVEYRMRHGDTYFHIVSSLGLDIEVLRKANALWQIQAVPTGFTLHIPIDADRRGVLQAGLGLPRPVRPLTTLAATTPRAATLATGASAPRAQTTRVHSVTAGDTLGSLAARYGTTVGAIQAANRMDRRTVIRVGQRLVLPSADGG